MNIDNVLPANNISELIQLEVKLPERQEIFSETEEQIRSAQAEETKPASEEHQIDVYA